MKKEKPTTKLCKHCKTEIPYDAKVCPQCRKKQKGNGCLTAIAVVIAIGLLGSCFGGKKDDSEVSSTPVKETTQSNEVASTKENTVSNEINDKYYVGDTWENKHIRVTYTSCYEFTDYNQYNAPEDGKKIICTTFEFENIGSTDTSAMYTDFHGYADGYEVSQSYAPEGTGLDFSIKMSAGRKGTGIVAFEVPEDAQEIEIEYSPNLWTSEHVTFVYSE